MFRRLLAVAISTGLLGLTACVSFHGSHGTAIVDGPGEVMEPAVHSNKSVHGVACDLDHLEKHIDWYGSVTAKVPDVWGQARLTVYREQFEEQMVSDLDSFKESLQGATSRADQAFAQSAIALGLAVSGTYATTSLAPGRYGRIATDGALTTTEVEKSVQVINQNVPNVSVPGAIVPKDSPKGVEVPEKSFFVDATTGNNRLIGFKKPLTSQDGSALNISIEPTEYLAQKKRYLDYLAQIRRINEGDDTADAPGYALNLIRVPVNVLPGSRTDKGHGAEVTMSLHPVFEENLLPQTFRRMVINDIVHQLGFPIIQVMNDRERRFAFLDLLNDDNKLVFEVITQLHDAASDREREQIVQELPLERFRTLYWEVDDEDTRRTLCHFRQIQYPLLKEESKKVSQFDDSVRRAGAMQPTLPAPDSGQIAPKKLELSKPVSGTHVPIKPISQFTLQLGSRSTGTKVPGSPRVMYSTALKNNLSLPVVSFSTRSDSKTAFPTSQIVDVYGVEFSFFIALAVREAFEESVKRQQYAHLPDVQSFLREELSAAYDLLSTGTNQDLWTRFCNQELVGYIRSRNVEALARKQQEFRQAVRGISSSDAGNRFRKEPMQLSRTAAFAWAILVDAAMLTEKIGTEFCAGDTGGSRNPFPLVFLPQPPVDVKRAFAEYVQRKWPIHVFALDPEVQEQNLADRLATRREIQLAAAMAFAGGRMNLNQLSRFARRLEAEYETVELNRTQIGFSHGPDQFGWRFYPRFQSPDTPSNLTLIARDLLIGGPSKDALLRQRKLEPGPRECVALVIAPSFVQSYRVDTSANFFCLTSPKHKVLDHTQAMKLSKTVKAVTTEGFSVADAECYRDGDLDLLMNRARQLSARLPFQSLKFNIPAEGGLGGFEMFGSSTQSLAPELQGWYGAPGVDAKRTTALFLVGDHFSPLRTEVLIGNQRIKPQMLSRQVMKVEFNPALIPLDRPNQNRVSIHVATPYGVTPELLVPVVNSDAVTPNGFHVRDSKVEFVATKNGDTWEINSVNPKVLVVAGLFAQGVTPTKVNVDIVIEGQMAFQIGELESNSRGLYTVPEAKLKEGGAAILARFKERFRDGDLSRAPGSFKLVVTPVVSAGQTAVPQTAFGIVEATFRSAR